MKLNFTKLILALFFISAQLLLNAQKSGPASSTRVQKKYPATFAISKTDFENLFSKKIKETLSLKSNKYLDKSSILMNTLNGDTKFMKIKLNYFQNAYLMIQVNGEYSTQIFILSDDKSVFYKGSVESGEVVMKKCNEDDIVSE